MGRSYYYFAASLPALVWLGDAAMTVETFLEDAARLLDACDYRELTNCMATDAPADLSSVSNPTVRACIRFEHNFRNEMAQFRAQHRGSDPQKHVRGMKENHPQFREKIVQASKMPNLLETQKFLDKVMWDFLDGLNTTHFYDLEAVVIYGLKLKILARHKLYRTPKGRGRLDEIRMAPLPESCILETEKV